MSFFKRTDIIIILCIIAFSVASRGIYDHVFAEAQVKAEIYYYSELVETVDLNSGEERVFSIPQDKNVVLHLHADGSIEFEESDCPDKVCMRAGKLKTAGQFAACLPNGIVVKIVPVKGYESDDTDLVVGN